jgi:hypothetical protein
MAALAVSSSSAILANRNSTSVMTAILSGDLEPDDPGGPVPASGSPEPEESPDELGIVGACGGLVEDDVEGLDVGGPGHPEQVEDGGVFRAAVLPAGPFELEDGPVTWGESGVGGRGVRG